MNVKLLFKNFFIVLILEGGRLDEELSFFEQARMRYYTKKNLNYGKRKRKSTDAKESLPLHTPIQPHKVKRAASAEIPTDSGLSGGFQVVIQTPEVEGSNILEKDSLLRHVKVLEEVARFEVEMFGE